MQGKLPPNQKKYLKTPPKNNKKATKNPHPTKTRQKQANKQKTPKQTKKKPKNPNLCIIKPVSNTKTRSLAFALRTALTSAPGGFSRKTRKKKKKTKRKKRRFGYSSPQENTEQLRGLVPAQGTALPGTALGTHGSTGERTRQPRGCPGTAQTLARVNSQPFPASPRAARKYTGCLNSRKHPKQKYRGQEPRGTGDTQEQGADFLPKTSHLRRGA